MEFVFVFVLLLLCRLHSYIVLYLKFTIFNFRCSALGPGVYSASNRNEYQKHKNINVSGE
jgi:hypothetical protein